MTLQAQIKWLDNLDDFKKHVEAGTDGIVAHTKTVDRLTRSLGGQGLMAAAHNTAAALEKLGGVSKLTSAEAERMHALFTKAAAKMEAMGQTVPPAFKQIAEATKPIAPSLSLADRAAGLLNTTIGKLGAVFAVGAIVGAAKQFLDLTGSLTDMSAKTGLSTAALQKLKYAAEQNGGSLDGVTASISKMNVNLANGDKGTVAALGKLGLSFADIRKMKPEDAFLTIGDAIAKVQDPMAQSALNMKIFGKAGADNLAMFSGHLRETADQAEKMGLVLSDDVVAAGDQFGDTLSTLFTAGMALLGQVLGPFLPLLQQLANIALIGAHALGVVLGDAIKLIVGVGTLAIEWIGNMAQKVFAFAEKIPGASAVLGGMKAAFAGVKDAAGWVHEKIAGLEAPVTTTTSALKKHGGAVLDVSDADNQAAAAAKKHAEEIKKLAEGLSGGGALKTIADLNEALRTEKLRLEQLPIDALDKLNKAVGAAIDVYRRRGEAAPRALQIEVLAIEAALEAARRAEAEFKQMHGPIQLIAPKNGINLATIPTAKTVRGDAFEDTTFATRSTLVGKSLSFQITEDLTRGIDVDQVKKAIAKKFQAPGFWKDTFGSAQQFGGELSSTILGAIQGGGNVLHAAGGMIGQKIGTSVAGRLSKSLLDTGSGLFSKALGGVLNSAIPVVGSLIGPLAGALWNHLFGTAGRDAVKQFAQSMGGFDDLHKKLGALGAAGEDLWKKLTQGVGRNNPEQAKKVIEEINAAFGGQDAYLQRLPGLMEKYGLTWEEAGQKAKQAHMDEIAKALIQDFADLSHAGFDVSVITEKMSKSVNEYVQQAIKTGTEVPSAMKPLIQKMIDMGTLTDDNGTKITSLEDSGITFATTLTEGFSSIVDAIHELTRALGGVPEAMQRIPRNVDIDVNYHEHGTSGGHYDPEYHSGTASVEKFHRGTAKILPFRPIIAHAGLLPDEVPAILQTGEAVLNRRAAAALGTRTISALNGGADPSGMGGGDEVHVYVTVDGETGEVKDKRIERVARRMALTGRLKPRAACGRGY